MDNVFVFALIFGYFAVPRMYQHRVLFYGVLGALVLRAIFIAGGAALIDRFHWVLYVFGAILLYTGWRMFRHRNHEMDLAANPVLRLARRLIPTTEDYDGQKFWVRRAGRWVATPLFMVLVLVETTDVIFAVDSIPAIFAITQEPFLVFTSNAFAILGLRAMYFLLADLMHRFVYLKAGLAAILILVGIKMLLIDIWKVPIALSLAAIATCLIVAMLTSGWKWWGAVDSAYRKRLDKPLAVEGTVTAGYARMLTLRVTDSSWTYIEPNGRRERKQSGTPLIPDHGQVHRHDVNHKR